MNEGRENRGSGEPGGSNTLSEILHPACVEKEFHSTHLLSTMGEVKLSSCDYGGNRERGIGED